MDVRTEQRVPAGQETARDVVEDSWRRSFQAHPRREDAAVESVLGEDELRSYREGHALAPVMPLISDLLVQPARDAGTVVAVGDETGRLLWIDGDSAVRRRAERMAFLEGADWSEDSIGTSAPGTALVTGGAVQITGPEHFSPLVEAFSCTAVPIRDPRSGDSIGVVDITGGEQAVSGYAMPLVRAAVAAAEERLRALAAASQRSGRASSSAPAVLSVTGRDHGVLRSGERTLNLSVRHSEILVLLADNPRGLTAEELSDRLYEQSVPAVTLRAELVRLRKVIDRFGGGVVLHSRPYRVEGLEVDSMHALAQLERGSHRLALNSYGGQILPRSESPAIAELRDELSATLREAVVGSAGADVLMAYLQLPEAADDAEAWLTALRLLPPRSPKRAGVVAHLERLLAA
ncbi:helix-turn-helix domain-containing protein [Sinomonas humi]|uniref:helix-turn-helix domain-containing protein n=1 Tax=Sinomonas humi TaxID=1338436 RepID=UPI00068DAB2D|nr:helix-turn-helix domain-containing protein [Sinomonas humi]